MSTQNIGFYEEIKKILSELHVSLNIIKYTPHLFLCILTLIWSLSLLKSPFEVLMLKMVVPQSTMAIMIKKTPCLRFVRQ